MLRGGVKKKLVLLVVGAVGGSRPDHNFRPKKYHFLFLLPFDAEAFKTCKNTINILICLLYPVFVLLTLYCGNPSL